MQSSKTTTTSKKEMNPLNDKLIDKLIKGGEVKSAEVEKAMRSIDRGDFSYSDPYNDRPQSIGYNATISAPHMHAYALEYLKEHLKRGKRCLDVGSGSGYLTLAFAKMMEQPDAVAYGIEHIPSLVKESIFNLEKNHKDYLTSGKVVITEGDGRKGFKENAPYDAIHVGAAAGEIPQDLIEQLAPGGRMLIPVGPSGSQDFVVVDKDESGKSYVPLTSKEKQWSSYAY